MDGPMFQTGDRVREIYDVKKIPRTVVGKTFYKSHEDGFLHTVDDEGKIYPEKYFKEFVHVDA